MDVISSVLGFIGTLLGYVMWLCFKIFKDYGVAIIFFTLLTKVIMFPISLLVQKNSIKMVKMKPELEALKYQYIDDKDAYFDAQNALYKKEKYSPMAGVWPLLLQLPIILGLIDVVYKPLKHLFHMPADVINAFVNKTAEIMNMSVDALGSSPQLKVVELIQNPEFVGQFRALSIGGYDTSSFVDKIASLNMNFFGINLAHIPSFTTIDLLFLVPVLAGLSALIMCIIQNKINVLQVEQNKLSQWGMTIFMIAFSTYFAFIVPTGVGLYWMWGNLFAIIVMYLVNIIYSPKKYIDYKALEELKRQTAADKEKNKRCKKLAKAYYKQFCRPENLEHMKLMFYAEGGGYYKYFSNIIDAVIEKSKLKIHYVTSDPDDPILENHHERIIPYYVDETRLISLMMKVEADMVVMTTPDLEKYHIKRSKVRRDVEYVYTDHGCTSINLTYRTGALDYFDTIFAVSPAQKEEVRAIEKLRGTSEKKIIEVGYGLIDNMIAAYESSEKTENEKKTILIAPSWQYDNIMDSCLDGLVEGLRKTGYRVIIRPHPQYIKRFPMRIKEIMEKYRDEFNEDFMIETDFSSNTTVYTADLLITDWSAIAYEYSFTTDKPTLFVNTQMKVVNRAYKKIKITPYDITARDIIGRSIEKDDIDKIGELATDLIENQASYSDQIHSEKESYFYNLGSSGEAAADYIISRLVKKKKKKQASSEQTAPDGTDSQNKIEPTA
ncbi:MAG: membrane protein insertase YidC [Clostridiales bacterium]|nr:membrane protein insertase YidC [Clostridiales bacterium]